jgi:hypothetical protein
MRAGLDWIDGRSRELFAGRFLDATEAQQIQILQPLSDEVDRRQRSALAARYRGGEGGTYYAPRSDAPQTNAETGQRPEPDAQPAAQPVAPVSPGDLPVRFFRLIKNLTADGYYTSRVGLVDELGYRGNTARPSYPACPIPEQ